MTRTFKNNKINLPCLIQENNMVDIAVVRSANSIIYDPRVKKIIGSLNKKYSVMALGWNRDQISNKEIENYMVKLVLFHLKTSFWKPSLFRIFVRLVVFFPPFWAWLFFKLIVNRPTVVHACDFDTLPPCYLYKILFRKKLVFDVFDRYGMALIPQRFKKLGCLINYFEDLYGKYSDALIIAGGQKVMSTFQKRPKYSEIILNCPEDYFNNSKLPTKNNTGNIKLVYTGGIRVDRSLENIAKVISELESVELHFAGPIIDIEVFNEMQKYHNVRYHGVLEPQDAISLELTSDILIAFYNPDILWNTITLPNKLFEAMMCRIPIITNVASEIVEDNNCGLIVPYNNDEQLRDAILRLRENPELIKKLGENGRKAFLNKYDWKIMEKKLYRIYGNFLPE
ncbi:MAG TPA: glycosyltransferase family 4 protein [Nitrososphaeraceae archaeon]|nr:glycosyltransferase family 4 protein [Nitrososphaeraceae archaeon]